MLNILINQEIKIDDYSDISNNLDKLKLYLKDNRTDIDYIEAGKDKLYNILSSKKIKIIDKVYSIEELSLLINYFNSKKDIGAVFIDCIQLLKSNISKKDKKNESMYISDYILTNIARKNNLPIILSSKISSIVSEELKLKHLNEEEKLDESSSLILSVYQKNLEEESTYQKDVDLEIKVLKNRDGIIKLKSNLNFDRMTGKISDYN